MSQETIRSGTATPTVFCDQNFLSNVGGETAEYMQQLQMLVKCGKVRFVLSPWTWVEIAGSDSVKRLRELAQIAESLQPKWLRERRSLQMIEVAECFYQFLNVPYTRPCSICPLSVVFSDLVGSPVVDAVSVLDLAVWIRAKGLKGIRAGYDLNAQARSTLIKQRRKSARLQAAVLRQYVGQLLPSETPAGLYIDEWAKSDFLRQIDHFLFPSIATEFALSDDASKNQAKLPFQTFMDRMHGIAAIPYLDVIATDDVRFSKAIKRVSLVLPFKTATVMTKAEFDARFLLPRGAI